eukprot:311633-Chlamydomonas_euryale.AAC.2
MKGGWGEHCWTCLPGMLPYSARSSCLRTSSNVVPGSGGAPPPPPPYPASAATPWRLMNVRCDAAAHDVSGTARVATHAHLYKCQRQHKTRNGGGEASKLPARA